MEPSEPRSEAFPGYSEMPDEFKGEWSVLIYQDAEGYYFIKMRTAPVTVADAREELTREVNLNLKVVAEFTRVSPAFVSAAEKLAIELSRQKKVKRKTQALTWRDIIKT